MNKKIFFGAILILFQYSCRENRSKTVSQAESAEKSQEQQTYAEISVKEGGHWEGGTYVGGSFQNKTELEVPKDHTDHSGFIRYEGPGWENRNVGYRLYLDWRNAIDIFGKKVDTMVLHQVGHPNSGSYHDDAPWGLDILKAGNSLGLGGFGRYMNDTVAHFRNVASTKVSINNQDTQSEVQIKYESWTTGGETIDLSAKFSIFSEDRYTKVELSPSSEISGLTTGIVKFEDIPLNQKEDNTWGYIATYGKQTLAGADDKLGMAIFYKIEEVEKVFEGPDDHLLVFSPAEQITYYFLAAWDQEKEGIKSKEEFIADLDEKLEILKAEGELKL